MGQDREFEGRLESALEEGPDLSQVQRFDLPTSVHFLIQKSAETLGGQKLRR